MAYDASSIEVLTGLEPVRNWRQVGSGLIEIEATPPLALTAHDGVQRSLATLRGKPVLLTFAYLIVPAVCAVMLARRQP